MNTALVLKGEKRALQDGLKSIAKMLKNILHATQTRKSEKAIQRADTFALLRTRLREFKTQEKQLYSSVERFFRYKHKDDNYSLCFLSYHMLLQKLSEISVDFGKHRSTHEAMHYLQDQAQQMRLFFKHTQEEAQTLHFWGKELLHELMDLVEYQVSRENMA